MRNKLLEERAHPAQLLALLQPFDDLWKCAYLIHASTFDHCFYSLVTCIFSRELHLQLHLLELQRLVAQASSEFRLKGPFPVALYRGILTSFQTILDNMHSIRCGMLEPVIFLATAEVTNTNVYHFL